MTKKYDCIECKIQGSIKDLIHIWNPKDLKYPDKWICKVCAEKQNIPKLLDISDKEKCQELLFKLIRKSKPKTSEVS